MSQQNNRAQTQDQNLQQPSDQLEAPEAQQTLRPVGKVQRLFNQFFSRWTSDEEEETLDWLDTYV